MRVLVTGGAGFIGSHVVDTLVANGHEVVVIDRRSPAQPNRRAQYHVADLCDADWRAVLGGVDAVSHQAARVGVGRSFADAPGYAADNDLGTAVLLAALAAAGFGGRLVLAASMVAYGEGAYRCRACGPVRPAPRTSEQLRAGSFDPPCPDCGSALDPMLVDEDAPLEPRSVYAATKVHQEQLCAAFARESGTSLIALRYHNVYGPRCPIDTPYAGVASLFVRELRAGRLPQVYEDGCQQRDFVHVSDVARANRLALEAPPGAEGTYNVASGQPRTVLEMAEELCKALGDRDQRPLVTGRFRLDDVRHIVASPARARHHLGFAAEVDVADGLAELARDVV